METISNKALREQFQKQEARGEATAAEIAFRCEWMTTDKKSKYKKPDSSRVNRTLGIVAEAGVYRTEVTEDAAVKLCRALHLDPWEIGL